MSNAGELLYSFKLFSLSKISRQVQVSIQRGCSVLRQVFSTAVNLLHSLGTKDRSKE